MRNPFFHKKFNVSIDGYVSDVKCTLTSRFFHIKVRVGSGGTGILPVLARTGGTPVPQNRAACGNAAGRMPALPGHPCYPWETVAPEMTGSSA